MRLAQIFKIQLLCQLYDSIECTSTLSLGFQSVPNITISEGFRLYRDDAETETAF
jgi:hypothetical protein